MIIYTENATFIYLNISKDIRVIVLYAYTKHALGKMDAYGFDKSEIEAVIKRGVKWKEEKRDIWHANMGNTEVVFARSNGSIVIITVYEARWKK